jgi:hypothetical protein
MLREEFEEIFEARVAKTRDLLINKAKEYAADADRLHNFKRGSQITGDCPAKVLDMFMLKHYVSYRDILDDIVKGKKIDPVKFEDKIGDLITYLFLQECVMLDSGLITK